MTINRTGNFHSLLLFKTDEELNTVRGLVHRMVERALALDGTCKYPSFFTHPLLVSLSFPSPVKLYAFLFRHR